MQKYSMGVTAGSVGAIWLKPKEGSGVERAKDRPRFPDLLRFYCE